MTRNRPNKSSSCHAWLTFGHWLVMPLLLIGSCLNAPDDFEDARVPTIELTRQDALDERCSRMGVIELFNSTQETWTYSLQIGSPCFFAEDLGNPMPVAASLMCGAGVTSSPIAPGERVRLCDWNGSWKSLRRVVGPIQFRMFVWDASGEEYEIQSAPLQLTNSSES